MAVGALAVVLLTAAFGPVPAGPGASVTTAPPGSADLGVLLAGATASPVTGPVPSAPEQLRATPGGGSAPAVVAARFDAAAPPTGTSAALFTSDAPDARVRVAIGFALAQLGLPYVWGGNGPGAGDAGFDCSGLTTASYAAAGIALPRTAQTQYYAGPHVPATATLLPGDLVFYGVPGRVHHVGMYLGAGKMINAPTFGKPVRVAYVRYPGDDYLGATRPAYGGAVLLPGYLPAIPAPTAGPASRTPSTVFQAPPAPAPTPQEVQATIVAVAAPTTPAAGPPTVAPAAPAVAAPALDTASAEGTPAPTSTSPTAATDPAVPTSAAGPPTEASTPPAATATPAATPPSDSSTSTTSAGPATPAAAPPPPAATVTPTPAPPPPPPPPAPPAPPAPLSPAPTPPPPVAPPPVTTAAAPKLAVTTVPRRVPRRVPPTTPPVIVITPAPTTAPAG